jgi:hypothetical protein
VLYILSDLNLVLSCSFPWIYWSDGRIMNHPSKIQLNLFFFFYVSDYV